MAGRPDGGTEPPGEVSAELRPLTDVTRWGLVGDIGQAIRDARRHNELPHLETDDRRIEFDRDGTVTFQDKHSGEMLHHLRIDDLSSSAELMVSDSEADDPRPLDEGLALEMRGNFAEAVRVPELPLSPEEMSPRQLRKGIIREAKGFLKGRDHTVVWSPSERFLHLFALQKGGVGISVEYPSGGTSMLETEDIVLSPDEAQSSLYIVPEEKLEAGSGASERERTEAARRMGLVDRDLKREELQRIYLDLKAGEIATE